MMLDGWTAAPTISNNHRRNGYKSPVRNLARLIDLKYGKVIDAPPQILTH
jgi:hypothetical protein